MVVIAAVLCCYAVQLKNRLAWDDALDVWGVHGVGGLLMGNPDFLWTQAAAAVVSGVWAFAFTYGMLWLNRRRHPGQGGRRHPAGSVWITRCTASRPISDTGGGIRRAPKPRRACGFLPGAEPRR
ncbi:hypothetical protein [Chromobacterium sphagni]|uniref:hypothetical protein n=1 Tax=Chromobacterium sphagni TaxID=1903179 RepID=UPI0023D86B37|nr:hypothetical protein [Chromobacterium sphagni]